MSSPRKVRTRHLIQLGGLLKKSGLSDALGLNGDLQNDPGQADSIAILMGGILFLRTLLDSPKGEEARQRFRESGAGFLRGTPEDDEEAAG